MVSCLTVSAIKVTKDILAQESENITMWAGYARLESKRGKLHSARAVYGAILAKHTPISIAEDTPALAMWADWVKMEWAAGDQDRYIDLLMCLADCRVPSEYPAQTCTDAAGRLLETSYELPKSSAFAKLKARQVSHIRVLPLRFAVLHHRPVPRERLSTRAVGLIQLSRRS